VKKQKFEGKEGKQNNSRNIKRFAISHYVRLLRVLTLLCLSGSKRQRIIKNLIVLNNLGTMLKLSDHRYLQISIEIKKQKKNRNSEAKRENKTCRGTLKDLPVVAM
jgi:hypothetical protein